MKKNGDRTESAPAAPRSLFSGALFLVLIVVSALAGSLIYFYVFTKWIPWAYGVSVALFAFAAGGLAARFASKKPLRALLVTAAAYAAVFSGLTYLINNVIYHERNARAAAAIISAVNLLFFIIFYAVISRRKAKKVWLAVCAFVLSVALTVCSMLPGAILPMYYEKTYRFTTAPSAATPSARPDRELIDDADFYVSPHGDDGSNGSFEAPFASLARARDAVRQLDKSGRKGVTVAVKAGEYRVDSIVFDPEDSGTADCPIAYRAYGDGEVIISGGMTLPRESFRPVSDEETRARLADGAKDKVLSVDLFALGITPEQYGKIYAIGGYNTASRYDGDWVGDIYCELFADDVRMTIARYPNGKEYLRTGAVVSEGEGREAANASLKPGFEERRNPQSDVYKLDRELADRIAGWKTLDDVWMFGYWRYDWADASTPVGSVDREAMTISPMFVSSYGAVSGAPYYFFNVFEELDAPGEWYLDRDNGVLYFYPPEGFGDESTLELSLSERNIISADADHLIFDGFTIKGTRSDAVSIRGDGNSVENCVIKNVAGHALIVTGNDNIVRYNEITRTGKGGVTLNGGDTETLRHAGNRAEDNLVHDWSEIYETYQPAFTLNGVGNICSHNEMYNSPHEAITYSGNDHLIEYNLIHDVNLLTDDGGAIYSGRRWDWYGTVIRYNLIYDLGANGHKPVGIYMDDTLAGQEIYGNIIINAPNIGIQLGGGRDLLVHDNIIVNSATPISYDDRGRTGLSGDESSSFYQHYKQNGSVWQLLFDSPWQSETWRKAYPQYERYSDDFNDTETPDFVLNPAYSEVKHNIIIAPAASIGSIAATAYEYSDVSDNAVFGMTKLKKIFNDPKNGDYGVRSDAPIDFTIDVPEMSEFGRR